MLVISKRTKLEDKWETRGYHFIFFSLFTTSHVVNFPIEYSHVIYVRQRFKLKYKGKAIPLLPYYRLWGFRRFQAPRFHDNRHMKVVMLSALSTSRICTPRYFPGTLFCLGLSLPKNIMRTKGLRQWNIPMTPSGIEPAHTQIYFTKFNLACEIQHITEQLSLFLTEERFVLKGSGRRPISSLGPCHGSVG